MGLLDGVVGGMVKSLFGGGGGLGKVLGDAIGVGLKDLFAGKGLETAFGDFTKALHMFEDTSTAGKPAGAPAGATGSDTIKGMTPAAKPPEPPKTYKV